MAGQPWAVGQLEPGDFGVTPTMCPQAVQYTMILLLASLFFSGFFLNVEQLHDAAKLVSLLLPVSYGMQMQPDPPAAPALPSVARNPPCYKYAPRSSGRENGSRYPIGA